MSDEAGVPSALDDEGVGEVARGAENLLEFLEAAEQEGYRTQFVARTTGDVICRSCQEVVDAAALDVHRVRRLEGASDAADELLAVWVACPGCGARGVMTLGYGPNAGAEDIAVLAQLPLDHADHWPAPSERSTGDGT